MRGVALGELDVSGGGVLAAGDLFGHVAMMPGTLTPMTQPPTPDQLRARVAEVLPGIRADLEDLVRIESVSADPARAAEVQRSAEAVRALFEAEGCETEIVSVDGGAPAVIAHKAGPEGYADRAALRPPRRAARERPRRVGLAAVRADRARRSALCAAGPPTTRPASWRTSPRCGSSATTSRSASPCSSRARRRSAPSTLPALLAAHQDRLAADVIVIADSGNWDIGEPALTTSLRGLVRADIEVRTLTHAVHSGMWGGLVPDALITLSRLIATLHDDAGDVAVDGLHRGPAADVVYPEQRLRAESGATAGVEWIGTGSVVERLWTKPALSITGLDAPQVDGASNTLVPTARAKISLRIAPGDTTANAVECLRRHLEAHVPWGAELTFTVVDTGEARRSTPRGRRTTPLAVRSARPGTAPSRWTWASAGPSRSSPSSSRRSRRPACWSPASRTPTPAPTARTRGSTSRSSSASSSPRRCCCSTSDRSPRRGES